MTDAIDQRLAAEAQRDHAGARRRGERLALLTLAIEYALRGAGLPFDSLARPVVFHVLADHLYGQAAIDIPPMLPADDDPARAPP